VRRWAPRIEQLAAMSLPYTAALTDPDEVARRRALEAFIFRTRWPLLVILLILTLAVRAVPLWLSLVALGGYLLLNLLRLPLMHRGTLPQLRWAGGVLFVLDMAILLVGLWPLLRRGDHPVQVVLLLLLLEAAHRLRMERCIVALICIVAVTLVLAAYTLALGPHDRAHRVDLVIWFGGFLTVSSAVVISRIPLAPVPRFAATDIPESDIPLPVIPPAVPLSPPTTPLTPQQRAVLRLVAEGLHTDTIAERLSLSPQTVRSHLRDINQRLDVHTREEAVRRARERCDLS